jgi:hypothetical protein
VTTTVLDRYQAEMDKRLARTEKFRRLADAAAAKTAAGFPAMVTTNGLVVPTGWGRVK